ncbi:hypothetical protein ACJJTC_000654 [Scirpophaga incertulas]
MSEPEVNTNEEKKGTSDFVEDGKNKMVIKCKYCLSKILEKKTAVYVEQEKELPLMFQGIDRKQGEIKKEMLNEYYHVDNMYIFENIGFTHQVDNYKYLTCADCEAGPVGYYDLDSKHSYIALSRIEHS